MVKQRSESPEDCHRLYCRFYQNQIGGALPVFRGAPDQYGDGLGDILKGVFRFLLPIATSAASKFITTTSKNLDTGHTLKEAAKAAILPTVGEAIFAGGKEALARHRGMQSADQNIQLWQPGKVVDQTGKGRKSRKRRKTTTKGKRKPRKAPKKTTSRKRKRVYKRKPAAAKRSRILPTNF